MTAVLVLAATTASCGRAPSTPTQSAGTTTVSAPTPTERRSTTTRQSTTSNPTDAARKDARLQKGQIAGIDFSTLGLTESADYADAVELEDQSRVLRVTVPAPWDQTDLHTGDLIGVPVPGVFASADLTDFLDSYTTPGLKLKLYGTSLAMVGEQGTLERLAGLARTAQECAGGSQLTQYDDGLYTGWAELWLRCGEAGAALLNIAASDGSEPAYLLVIEMQLLTTADVNAAVRVIQTFEFTGGADDISQAPTTTARR